MKIICELSCFVFLILGCQERLANNNKKLNATIATDLNNKAEELLHSNPDSVLVLLDSALKFNSEDYLLYFNKGHVYIGKGEYLKTIDISNANKETGLCSGDNISWDAL